MYQNRRRPPERNKAAAAERIRRGLPAHRPPHFGGGGWYLVTAATYEHRPLFGEPTELAALERRLQEACSVDGCDLSAWVVFPNHYHLVLRSADLRRLGRALGGVHGRSSRYANARDGMPGRKVWHRFSDRVVRNDRHYATCLHYVFMNPVKHGYVDDALAWEWSNLGDFIRENGEERFGQLRRDYPLKGFGRGWND